MRKAMLVAVGIVMSSIAAAQETSPKEKFIPGDERALAAQVMRSDPAFVIVLNKDGTMDFLECTKGCRERRGADSMQLLSSGFIYWEKVGKVGGDPCVKLKTTSGSVYERCW